MHGCEVAQSHHQRGAPLFGPSDSFNLSLGNSAGMQAIERVDGISERPQPQPARVARTV